MQPWVTEDELPVFSRISPESTSQGASESDYEKLVKHRFYNKITVKTNQKTLRGTLPHTLSRLK